MLRTGMALSILCWGCGNGTVSYPPPDPIDEENYSRTFTQDEDFDEGSLLGVNHDTSGELRLNATIIEFGTPYLWAPLSNKDKAVRVDTSNLSTRTIDLTHNGETCRNPSRSTVDESFGVWMGCRGRKEGGDKVVPDRKVVHLSADGVLDKVLHAGWAARAVSLDAYGHLWVGNSYDGTVWEFDTKTGECILGESTAEQTCRDVPICLRDVVDGQPCGSVTRSDPTVRMDGGTYPYGAMVDQRGSLWIVGQSVPGRLFRIAGPHLQGAEEHDTYRYDVEFFQADCPGSDNRLYGIAVDFEGDVWTGGWTDNDVKKFNGETGAYIGCYHTGGDHVRGVAIDIDGNIWAANSNTTTTGAVGNVTQFDVTGRQLQTIALDQGSDQVTVTTGVGIDAYGNIWSMGAGSNLIMQFDPRAPLSQRRMVTVEGNIYTYSDFLGTAYRTVTSRIAVGRWGTMVDSGCAEPAWHQISWTSKIPDGASLHVDVACAHDPTDLPDLLSDSPAWRRVNSDDTLPCTNERYLAIRALFGAPASNKGSPVLEDLSVRWKGVAEQ